VNSVINYARPLCAIDRRVWSRRRLHPYRMESLCAHSLRVWCGLVLPEITSTDSPAPVVGEFPAKVGDDRQPVSV